MRAKSAPARTVERARIVLLSAEGLTGREIAQRVGCLEPTVVPWWSRYAARGLAGLEDAPRSGRPPLVEPTKSSPKLARLWRRATSPRPAVRA